jgi:hypothetical protein
MTHARTSEGNTSGEEGSQVARSTMSAEAFLSLLEEPDVSARPPGPRRSPLSDEDSLAPAFPQHGTDKSQG